ncbi:MAG: ribonuclease Z [Acidimicrobiia bacterium]|nr:ribonuclease Z [Acidimicrobiia bacterium]
MELTFLGTSSGTPTMERNVTGLALRIDGHWDLFDCGEATQHQLLKTSLSLSKLRRIFISHLHGDHCFGLFGLLGSRSMDGTIAPLTIYGPPGLKAMLETVLTASSTHLAYPMEIHEVSPDGGRVIDDAAITVDAVPLTHRVTSLAWSVREGDRPGQFNVEAARAAGVPEGPMFAQLQRGESVELTNGQTVKPDRVTGPSRPGRRIVISGDNAAPAALFETTAGADVAVHEATYTEPVLATLGDDRGHSTAERVAAAAQANGVRNLVLTHFSPRYTSHGDGLTISDVRDEARQHFRGGLHLANDFDRIEISHDGSEIRPLT